MKKLLFACLAACVCTGLFADGDYDKAIEHFKKREYDRALPFLEETVTAYPDWYPAVYFKGRCNYHLEKYKSALVDFNDALTMEVPSEQVPNIKYYIARTYMGMEDYPKALAMLDELSKIAPPAKQYDIFSNRAQCQLKMARSQEKRSPDKAAQWFAKSVTSFDKAFKSKTKDPRQKTDAGFQKAWAQFRAATLTNDLGGLKKSSGLLRRSDQTGQERKTRSRVDDQSGFPHYR